MKEAIIPIGTNNGVTDRDIDLKKLKSVLERCGVVITERKSSPCHSVAIVVCILTGTQASLV